MFVARAPGKLVALGEYAVLDGAPAVVLALDRYVEATIAPERATARAASSSARAEIVRTARSRPASRAAPRSSIS